MLQPIKNGFRETVQYDIQLEHCRLSSAMHVYRRTVSQVEVAKSHKTTFFSKGAGPKVVTGFVDDKNLKLLKRGWEYRNLDAVYVAKEDYRDQILRHGTAALKEVFEEPYRELVENGVSLDRVVRWDSANSMLYDVEGLPIPQRVPFCQMNGRLSANSNSYNLPNLLKLLQARDDVEILNGSNFLYYESDDGSLIHYIEFVWYPTADTYRQAWEKAQTYKPHEIALSGNRMCKAVINLDLLGTKKALLKSNPDKMP